MLYFTKTAFDEKNLRELSELSKKDPKLFWNGVKKLMNDTKIGSTDLFIHQSGYPALRNSFLQDNLKGKI